MAKTNRYSSQQSNELNVCKFRLASFDLLTDFLEKLNKENKNKLNSLSKCSGNFRHSSVMESILFMTKALRLDPHVGYHANELLQSFMIKHLTHLLTTPSLQGASGIPPISYEDAVLDLVKEKFPFIIFSCVQLASKMSLHVNIIDNNTAVHFLQSLGFTATKKYLLDSELMVLKGLDFKLEVANPLIYVEILLEVLGYNKPSVPIEHIYDLCQQVLQFVVLERFTIYDSLLMVITRSQQPTTEQREKFVTVTEDWMLLGVAVIAAALYIFHISQWEEVVRELSNTTGISWRTIMDFAVVILLHLTDSSGL
ncbi:cyclin N-terminal domain-containing protein 1 [Periophthalmus magnuspinnatus]|uniref:cyclin N-terminal domain-containing protein 1 n=1 Tax=Periophthalmus magnuspinnatus TaxID=409849 RepID=UPI00145A29F7|nr:cyclin N-terminal domain-containing protein 1 [Periophthalmus magnuspinnatus]